MKKLGGLILGIIIGAAAMYYYCTTEYDVVDSMVPISQPKGLISPKEIKVLTEAYNPRYDSISSQFFRGVEGGDNRSSWYSLEELNKYLGYAQAQADTLQYTFTGVRLYLAAHPSEGDVPGYTTILFAPTGYPNKSQGSFLNFKYQGGGDLPGGDGLNHGGDGKPPGANYPQ